MKAPPQTPSPTAAKAPTMLHPSAVMRAPASVTFLTAKECIRELLERTCREVLSLVNEGQQVAPVVRQEVADAVVDYLEHSEELLLQLLPFGPSRGRREAWRGHLALLLHRSSRLVDATLSQPGAVEGVLS